MNKKYILCLFPLTGVVTGSIMCALWMLCKRWHFDASCFSLAGAAIPVLLSAGVPLNGFLKTVESLVGSLLLKAGGGREEKQPDFYAVIAAGAYYMLYASGLVLVEKERQLFLLGVGYLISRVLVVMAFLWFPGSEKEKDSSAFVPVACKKAFRIIFSIILVLCFFTCMLISPIMGVLEALLSMWVWTYCYYMSKKRFGGMTKAVSGYLLTLCELAIVLFAGIFGKI